MDPNASWIITAIQNVLAFKFARRKLLKYAGVMDEATKEYANWKNVRANSKKTSRLSSWDHVVSTNVLLLNKICYQIHCKDWLMVNFSYLDPCEDHECQYGGQCVVDDYNRPICSCEEVCNDMIDFKKLCGTDGITYKNLCEMKRLSCDQQRDIKVNYTGSCGES